MTSPSAQWDKLTPRDVDEIHKKSDVDRRPESQHHRIGQGPNQAAPGKHYHNGSDSPFLIDPNDPITGSRTLDADDVLNQIMNKLAQIGLSNGTTP